MIRAIPFLLGLFVFTAIASAQYGDFALSGGYSHMYPEKAGSLFFDKDGEYVDANFAWRIPGIPYPVFFGAGLGASGYFDSQQDPFLYHNNGGDFFGTTDLYSDVEMIEVEPRLAVRLVIPGLRGFYIRPQIGAGLLIDDYSVDSAQPIGGITYLHTLNHTGAAFDIHPDVEAGFSWGRASFGGDLSYLASWGDFGQMGSVMQELRVGVFIRFRY